MEAAYKTVCQLVTDFKENEKAYLSSSYQESQVRQDFIDKFFIALGWDVTHTHQKNPYQQEVKIENRVIMPSTQRRADYAFAVSPNYDQVKFFVEAKKPSRSLANPNDYFQTIRYAWSAGTPLAVLTDFEEFHILDCRYKPDFDDTLHRKLEYFHYSQYADIEIFKRIFYLFGRNAVYEDSLEKYVETLPKPRGKAIQGGLFKGGYKSVDVAFLEQLDEYRIILAKAFKKENLQLDGEELTEAVQRTIDRLVFIRFLEDKGIEDYEIVSLYEKQSSWNAFISLCKRLEPKYNGLIFKPHRILDSKTFNPPDDRIFADICAELSDTTSPYDFDKIPISILGSIYERFLGKVVHATEKRVKVEEKPEVRKAGGVYYTPEYIVKYIVKETIGKMISGKHPKEIKGMAFADIACGSGSFLIEVYNQLLDYHQTYYNDHPGEAEDGDLILRDGVLRLSLKKKKEILVNCVFGVDIDFQATEVTQLSLYLKLLENATAYETHQLGLFKETILPSLNNNIVCGNSLIRRDIVEDTLFPNIDESIVRPMHIEDVFPKIMKRGGFDAIVGNPPYGAEIDATVNAYLCRNYQLGRTKETYAIFIEQALRLLKRRGLVSYIIPSSWIGAVDFLAMRELLLKHKINEIITLPFNVFEEAYIDTLLLIVEKNDPDGNVARTYVYEKKAKIVDVIGVPFQLIDQQYWLNSPDKKFVLEVSAINLITKLQRSYPPLSEAVELKRGILFDKELLERDQIDNNYFQYFDGDVYRYRVNYSFAGWIPFDDRLKERPKEMKWFQGERLLLRRLVNRKQRMMSSFVDRPFITNKNLYSLLMKNQSINIKYILGLLNSKLLSYLYISQVSQAVKNDFPQVTIRDVLALPFSLPDESTHNKMVTDVNILLTVVDKLVHATTDAETYRLQTHAAALERQIDETVYALYGLTEKEIQIVQGEQ